MNSCITCVYTYICTLCRTECEHFSLLAPDFSLVEELGADISQQEQTWALYEEFSSGLDGLCTEDWISFRSGHCCSQQVWSEHSHKAAAHYGCNYCSYIVYTWLMAFGGQGLIIKLMQCNMVNKP